jgi:hypothetical protein
MRLSTFSALRRDLEQLGSGLTINNEGQSHQSGLRDQPIGYHSQSQLGLTADRIDNLTRNYPAVQVLGTVSASCKQSSVPNH